MKDKIGLFLNILDSLCCKIVIFFLIMMIFLIFSQVFFRYVLNKPLSWTEEVSRHLMIWATFIAAAVAYRRNAHLGIDIFVKILPIKFQKIVSLSVYFIMMIYSFFIVFNGFNMADKTMRQISSGLGYKMGYIYLAIPVSFIFFLIFTAEKILETYSDN